MSPGTCPTKGECSFKVFTGLYFVAAFINFLPAVCATNSLLRVVPVSMKSQALGLNTFIFRLIGTIPGPLIGGVLIDKYDHICFYYITVVIVRFAFKNRNNFRV